MDILQLRSLVQFIIYEQPQNRNSNQLPSIDSCQTGAIFRNFMDEKSEWYTDRRMSFWQGQFRGVLIGPALDEQEKRKAVRRRSCNQREKESAGALSFSF